MIFEHKLNSNLNIFLFEMTKDNIEYSEKYFDDEYEYRQVKLPKERGPELKDKGLLSDEEWRKLGIAQSKGWVHYDLYSPEPHILLFRRLLGTDPRTGLVDPALRENFRREAEQKRRALLLSCK
ncbi:unnamed protein product [Blepharisma stoltei]|uniref:Cyclin-dependent kinases regulatory subunit n=1 Tax=Blepharisma stoltei TaxID=1481888 RepID=A0AAU9JF86_9CILI|nr:unnamed protein product [Blepharisma stoltei]